MLKKKGDFYHLKITKVSKQSQIIKPSTFPSTSFPEKIISHIDNNMFTQLTYSFYLLDKKIKIHFLLEDIDFEPKKYNEYADNILIWLIIINDYASKKCASEVTIFFYFTSLTKNIPVLKNNILDENNINTAFTFTCPVKSEIIIYRKEEWFKVFLHETFHNFGLDFSDMKNDTCNSKILDIFPVNSEVNLYESYCEFWAKIMNSIFCSYHLTNNLEDFLNTCILFINLERVFSYFQMVKVLDFMDLNYNQLFKKGLSHNVIRKSLYKEKTNILSYYIVTLILLNNYPQFIEWCDKNNTSLLQFKKTFLNQINFCKFIETKYKSTSFLKNIKCFENLFQKLKLSNKKQHNYINTSLRMTICELG